MILKELKLKILKAVEVCATFSEDFCNDEFWDDLLEEDLEHFRKQPKKVHVLEPFNRNGLYYSRSLEKAWVEFNGEIFDISKESFDFYLSLHEASELRKEEIEALYALKGTKFQKPKHKKLLDSYEQFKRIQAIKLGK